MLEIPIGETAPNSVEPDKMLLKCDITSGSSLFAKVLMEISVLSPPMHILELLYHSIIDLVSMLSSESKRIRQRRTLLHVPLLKIICILTTHPTFHWTAIPLRSWRSRIFSKIIPNRRGSVDNHTIWGLGASSTLLLRFRYASVTTTLR